VIELFTAIALALIIFAAATPCSRAR